MSKKLGILLYFAFLAAAIVMIFALVFGLGYLLITGEEPFTLAHLSGSLFFIILAGIFWVCGLAAKHFLTDVKSPPPGHNT